MIDCNARHPSLKVVTISGPSATGKSTIEQDLVEQQGFVRLRSHTTRLPRPGEGGAYEFISKERFRAMLGNREFVDHTVLGKGETARYYGLSKATLDEALGLGRHAAVVVDPVGARQMAEYCHNADIAHLSVFIGCPAALAIKRLCERAWFELSAQARRGDPLTFEQTLETHSHRLSLALTTERRWSRADYDLRFPHSRNERERYWIVREIAMACEVSGPRTRWRTGRPDTLPGLSLDEVRPIGDEMDRCQAALRPILTSAIRSGVQGSCDMSELRRQVLDLTNRLKSCPDKRRSDASPVLAI